MFLRFEALDENLKMRVDLQTARLYVEALQKLAKDIGLSDRVRLSHLLRIEGLIKPQKCRDVEGDWIRLEPCLEKARRDFATSRAKEGEKIESDIVAQLARVEDCVEKINRERGDLKAGILESLRQRFQEMLGEAVDENRIYAETALLLMKFDINEELMRLRAHIAEFREAIAEKNQSVGKKLDFICQELNREINTISSKSMQHIIHSTVIRAKDSIEKIREQLRNVE